MDPAMVTGDLFADHAPADDARIALGEALVEFLDRLSLLLANLAHLGARRVDLGPGCGFLAVGIRELRLQRRKLVRDKQLFADFSPPGRIPLLDLLRGKLFARLRKNPAVVGWLDRKELLWPRHTTAARSDLPVQA